MPPHPARPARRTAIATAATVIGLVLTSCTGSNHPLPAHEDHPNTPTAHEEHTTPDTTTDEPLETVTGSHHIRLTITRVQRSATGQSVTVSGMLKNTGDTSFFGLSAYGGNDESIKRRSNSVAGAAMVDPAHSMRYYVLRDTAGGCLCTTGITAIKPGEPVPIFAQFPAPPKDVRSIDFQLPTVPNITLPLGSAR